MLATELYKIANRHSPNSMEEIFPFDENTNRNTKNLKKFHSRTIKLVTFGCETVSYQAPKIWELARVEIKNVESVTCFKRAIKKWKPMNCFCRLCWVYSFQIGFV